MIGARKSLPTDLETPVGLWRCIRSRGDGPQGQFREGELYPCIQNGRSVYPQGTAIPIHRRSYRLFRDSPKIGQGELSFYWDHPSQSFSCYQSILDFEFARRFTYAEQKEFLAKGCDPNAFDSLRPKKAKLSIGDALLNRFFGNKAPEPALVGSTPEAPLRYYFEYKSTAEGRRAVIFKRTHEWGIAEVGSFKYGVDAQEYVDIKNVQLRRQRA